MPGQLEKKQNAMCCQQKQRTRQRQFAVIQTPGALVSRVLHRGLVTTSHDVFRGVREGPEKGSWYNKQNGATTV